MTNRRFLRHPEGGAGGGAPATGNAGTGEAGAAGNGAGPTLEQITDLVNKTVNGAMARRLGEFKTEVIRGVEEILTENAAPAAPPKGKEEPDSRDKRLKFLEDERVKDKADAAESRKDTALDEALAEVGITAISKRHKAGLLMEVEESDGHMFVGNDPLDKFARDFARSDEGKRLIPAKGGSGTGSVPSTGAAGAAAGGEEPSLNEVMQALVEKGGAI